MAARKDWPLPQNQFRKELDNIEDKTLAPYATRSAQTRTRDGIMAVIRDYIQGMTDRFLQEEYKRAFSPQILI